MPPSYLIGDCCSPFQGILTSVCRLGLKNVIRSLGCGCPPPPCPPPPCPPPPCPPPCDLCKTGYKQSPVDICSTGAKKIELPSITFSNHFNDDVNLCMYLMDDTINLVPNSILMSMEGGPLTGMFVLDKCHFHWGLDENEGSEHSIDKRKYAMEAHLKYYNCQFGSFDKAQNKPDGIAIISVLMAAKPGSINCDFDAVVRCLPSVVPGKTFPITKNVFKMFENTLNTQKYFTYEGSITIPPCAEEVTWLVFKNIMSIDCSQVAPFRKLCNCNNEVITNNCRDIQSLNGRSIYDVKSRPKENDCS